MAALEGRLRDLTLFESHVSDTQHRFLTEKDKTSDRFLGWMVQDDHIPFMARGVEILHIIPTPFPRVWHEVGDDGEHLDMPTVEDWTRLIIAFLGEWMDLEGYFPELPMAASVEGRGALTSKTEL